MRLFLSLMVLMLCACDSPPLESQDSNTVEESSAPVAVDPSHNSRNALDWAGSYTGTVPCADCEGIRTTITLRDDGTFDRERLYLGKSCAPMSDSGLFTWNEAGSIVTLAAGDGATQRYQVGENQLFHLDQSGHRITGDLAAQYVLRQSVRVQQSNQ